MSSSHVVLAMLAKALHPSHIKATRGHANCTAWVSELLSYLGARHWM